MARATIELPEYLADPFGTLERARKTGWLADMTPATGVVRYADVRQLLGDSRLRASFADFLHAFGINSGPFYEWMAMSPLNRDGADHVRWRSVLSRTFTPRRVEQTRPFLRRAAHELIDGFAGRGACEFVGEFADAFPSLGLCELIGVPFEDRDRFRQWANTIGLGFSPIELLERIGEVDAALTQLLAYTAELAAARRTAPRDDLITRIAQAGDEDGWSNEMIHGAIAGLVFAGHETTKNQLGWMVAVLSERPAIWDGMAKGEFAVDVVVEEVLRYRSAATGVGRVVVEPIEKDGERLEPGTQVLLSLWSADQDEAAFPKPAAVDPARNADVPHLAFGHGAHHCLGAALARAELQEALSALSARLSCPVVGADAVWKPAVGINGPLRLPITFAARSE
jgi:cytochrome P450